MEHKAYIDSLRGFAIFVVVVGHCCEFGLGRNDTLFNYMYFSFHMPLFMFISGLVAFHRDDYSFIPFVKSKVYRLMIPFFVVGSLSCFARGISLESFFFDFAKKGYWFLPVLFLILLIMFPAYKVNIKCNKKKILWKEILIYSFPLILSIVCYKILPDSINNVLATKYIVKLYPFVFMGMLVAKYDKIYKFLNKDLVKGFLIITSIVSFVLLYQENGAVSIVGYFLVPIIYLLFKQTQVLATSKFFIRMGGRHYRYISFTIL